jgi:anti-anti-sigma factor
MTRDGAAFPALRCELRRDETVVVRAEGELEEFSSLELAQTCLDARELTGDVVLDLGGLTFADGTGTKMIATMQRAFTYSGHRLTIVNVPAHMRREAELLEPQDDALRIAS